MLRTTAVAAATAAAALVVTPAQATPKPAPDNVAVAFRADVVAGGMPRPVVEDQDWSTYAVLYDGSGKRIGDASISCTADKVKEKRVLAHCVHTLSTDQGVLMMQGTHHYKDQTVVPGVADPMRLMVTGGTGTHLAASGEMNVTEVSGGYTYRVAAPWAAS
ncbi:allene oxide cyclase barrel-like domain-containing protein [Yinghuangia seranimata]|uniref:allene oxide cyclase barrel-like domain-containing protein n=1 Tax=Yinghuangia seranimata TaxID=408067 RepID=UPI00248BDD81|nr:hypothetical protein [Yinghuangia seranimata]MDI2129002.1 hypothetical protein [Yinghuangia seranimata]